jgi:predicted CoA-substrate-specific enzyme activase
MLCAGVDVGQHSIKAVVLNGDRQVAQALLVSEADADTGARLAVAKACNEAGLVPERLDRICATGLGRKEVPFAHLRKTQETCVARGAFQIFGRACTVLDAGAGGCRAVRMGSGGKVLDFASNSKCASGTGSFLEAACEVLQINLDRLDTLARRATDVARVSTTCAVFAESAIISNVHYGFSLESICAGICESVASRLIDVLNRVGVEKELFFCGGVARSRTLQDMLEKLAQVAVHVVAEPRFTAALGAALSSH